MNLIGTIIAKIIEYFVTLFVKFLADKWRKKKQIEQDETLAHDNAEKMEQAKTHEELIKKGEDLLNGAD